MMREFVTRKSSDAFRRISTLPLAQREVALLLMLSIAASLLFFTTRTLAGWSRTAQAREAAIWFARGEAMLEQGQPTAAVPPLRRAVQANRQDRAYAVMLARALIGSGR